MTDNVSSGSATHFPCSNVRSLALALVGAMCLSACTTVDAGATTERRKPLTTTSSEIAFDTYEISFGTTERRTVLPGFFLDGTTAELAMVSVNKNGNRRLQLYCFEGDRDWESVLDTTLGSGVLFVDVARIGGRDRVITYERGRFSWFDTDLGTLRPFANIDIDYNTRHDHEGSPTQPAGEPPRIDVTRDLNGDGRDDLLVPDFDGFWVSVQRTDGTFTEATKLGPPEPYLDELVGNMHASDTSSDEPDTYRDVGLTAATMPLYLGRVHAMDYNQDGRSDLVFWNEDHFEVYLQDVHGRFATSAESFVTDVPFDSDGIYSHAFVFRDQSVASFLFGTGKKTHGSVLYALRDLNGDGVTDLVTLTLSGRGINRQRSVYEVHFGTATPEEIIFAPEVGTVIRPRGKGAAMQPWGYATQRFEDLDGDGQLESLFGEVSVGLGGMFRALVGNSVPVNIEVFRMDDGVYPDKATYKRKIRRFAPFAGWGNVFFPPVVIGDVNGDGRADLLVGEKPKELQVFVGVHGPKLFARKPNKFTVDLPSDERNMWLTDLNSDGKKDVLVNYTSGNETHRVSTLIAR